MKRTFKRLLGLTGAAALAAVMLLTNLTGFVAVRAAAVPAFQTTIDTRGFKTEYELDDYVWLPAGDFGMIIKGPNGEIGGADIKTGGAQSEHPGQKYIAAEYAGWYTIDFYQKAWEQTDAKGKKTDRFASTRTVRFRVTAKNYSIEVAFNGADIPTFVGTKAPVPLPSARLIYTDAKGKTVADESRSGGIEILVTGAGFNEWTANVSETNKLATGFETGTYTGKYNVKYYYALGGAFIQKDFVMNVDDTYTESADKPDLTVNGMRENATLFTKLTLPTASATDKRDTNVKITVAIETPDAADSAKVYTVRDDKWIDEKSGYIKDDYKDVYFTDAGNGVGFETSYDMTFYPHYLEPGKDSGDYKVTYTATNDDGVSTSKQFAIKVSRPERPVIKIDSTDIPSRWAYNNLTKRVQTYDETMPGGWIGDDTKEYTLGTGNDEIFDLVLPYIAADEKYVMSSSVKAENFSSVEIAFKRPDASQYNVIYTSDSKAASGYFADPKDSPYYKEIPDGFGGFEPHWVIPAVAPGGNTALNVMNIAGNYEIRYTAVRDNTSPGTALSYFTVAVSDRLDDREAPFVTVDNLQKFVKFGEAFTKPAIKVSDNVAVIRSDTKYFLYEGVNVKAELDSDMFFNGKVEKFDFESVKEYLKPVGTDPLKVDGSGDNIAIVPAVNITTEANFLKATSIKIITYAVDAVGNQKLDNRTEVILINTTTGNYVWDWNDPGALIINPKGEFNIDAATGVIDRVFDLSDGWFTIPEITATLNKADDYMGFEIIVRNADKGDDDGFGYGDIVDDVEATFWVDSYNWDGAQAHTDMRTLHIEDFSFKPSAEGLYSISINIFDVTGATISETLFLEVTGKNVVIEVGRMALTLQLPANVEFGSSVSLPNIVYTYLDGGERIVPEDPASWENIPAYAAKYSVVTEQYIYRTTISGAHFSISGRDMTPWANGNFIIRMQPGNVLAEDEPYMPRTTDSFTADSTVSPTLQLMGVVPAVHEKIERPVIIPGVIASSISGIRPDDVKIEVATGSSPVKALPVTADDINDPKFPEFAGKEGWHKFYPGEKDGKYTVTYRVTGVNGRETSQSYTIDVGDVFAPEITVLDASGNSSSNPYKTTMKVGDTFKFFDATAMDRYFKKDDNGNTLLQPAEIPKTGEIKMKLELNGEIVHRWDNNSTAPSISSTYEGFKFEKSGEYTVRYTCADAAGNEGVKTFTIRVTDNSRPKLFSDKALAVIFSVLGVIVVAGVVYYFVGVRRRNTR